MSKILIVEDDEDIGAVLQRELTKDGFEVTKFDEVADGAGNEASAKQIFGENYDAFHEINSNEEMLRRVFIEKPILITENF